MIATSAHRVAENTADPINEQIRRWTDMNVAYFAAHPEEIDSRLEELDREWDIERALEVSASTLSMLGFVMGILGRRRWLLLPVMVQGFFLQHAIQGWCPPLPALRRMGFRTQAEIEAERYALKAIRGDFEDLAGEDEGAAEARADKILRAIRKRPSAAGMSGAGMGLGDDFNRRPRPSENPGATGKESDAPGNSLGMDEEQLPRPDVGPTS